MSFIGPRQIFLSIPDVISNPGIFFILEVRISSSLSTPNGLHRSTVRETPILMRWIDEMVATPGILGGVS